MATDEMPKPVIKSPRFERRKNDDRCDEHAENNHERRDAPQQISQCDIEPRPFARRVHDAFDDSLAITGKTRKTMIPRTIYGSRGEKTVAQIAQSLPDDADLERARRRGRSRCLQQK